MSPVIYLAYVCIAYLYLWYTHLQFLLISGLEIVFGIIKFISLTSILSQKLSHLLFSVFCLPLVSCPKYNLTVLIFGNNHNVETKNLKFRFKLFFSHLILNIYIFIGVFSVQYL